MLTLFSVTISINEIVNRVQCVYTQMVTILHTETFATFDFDPSLISRQITDSRLKSNEFSGLNWWKIGLHSCINEIAEIFHLSRQIGKPYSMPLPFCRVYIGTFVFQVIMHIHVY